MGQLNTASSPSLEICHEVIIGSTSCKILIELLRWENYSQHLKVENEVVKYAHQIKRTHDTTKYETRLLPSLNGFGSGTVPLY